LLAFIVPIATVLHLVFTAIVCEIGAASFGVVGLANGRTELSKGAKR